MKIEKEIWCFHCEHEWIEPDYINSDCDCPNCNKKPHRTYRTDSTSFVYAFEEKKRKKNEK